jgi:hypothetical protein
MRRRSPRLTEQVRENRIIETIESEFFGPTDSDDDRADRATTAQLKEKTDGEPTKGNRDLQPKR